MKEAFLARVLITGGAGFLGSHLCDRFINDGHDVICMWCECARLTIPAPANPLGLSAPILRAR